MKKPEVTQKNKQPTCLAELDFEILCKTKGREFAIRAMLEIIAIRNESAAKKISN